jgi:hypothetical protein
MMIVKDFMSSVTLLNNFSVLDTIRFSLSSFESTKVRLSLISLFFCLMNEMSNSLKT